MAMAKRSTPETQNENVQIFESPEVLQENISRTQEFADKNKSVLTILLAVILLAVGGVFVYKMIQRNQDENAQAELSPAVFYFEQDSLQKALNGDNNNTQGFLYIIDEYGLSEAANLAHFYAGASYLKLGEYENAIEHLSAFSSDDLLIQPRAYALIGDAYMQLKQPAEAISYYKQAAGYEPNKQFTPLYMKKLALAYEEAGQTTEASPIWSRIVSDYPESIEATEARRYATAE